MTMMPHTTTAPTHPVRRWEHRLYPGDLAQTSRVRADLRTDLATLPAATDDLIEAFTLCASEAFANTVEHTRSGDPDGRVIRTLALTAPTVLRLGLIDDGAKHTQPAIPTHRTTTQWDEAESGRGLLLIEHLSTAWGTRPVLAFPFCADQGTLLWAEFTLPQVTP